jgi:hypothetical protein
MPTLAMKIDIRMKRMFFDREQVISRAGQAKARMLSLVGRDVQQEGRKLIGRQAKHTKPRPPGKPPKSHVPDGQFASLRTIFYHSDGAFGVIIGPVGLNQFQYLNDTLSAGTVPALMEEGGTAGIREVSWEHKVWKNGVGPGQVIDSGWHRIGRRRPRPGEKTRVRLAHYPARPFMKPALRNVLARYARKKKYPGLTLGPSAAAIGPQAAAIGPLAA